jgi:hypothetical protein
MRSTGEGLGLWEWIGSALDIQGRAQKKGQHTENFDRQFQTILRDSICIPSPWFLFAGLSPHREDRTMGGDGGLPGKAVKRARSG